MPAGPNRDGALMARMAAATGADFDRALVEGRLAAADVAAARRRCAACLHDDCCRQWLDRSATRALPPAFCPNGAVFGRAASAAPWRGWR